MDDKNRKQNLRAQEMKISAYRWRQCYKKIVCKISSGYDDNNATLLEWVFWDMLYM